MTTEIKLPFGLRNEQLVHISEVERGLACDCICPACHQRLVARKGPDRTHHFAHDQGDECEQATETALHLAAKEIIEQEKQLCIPPVTFSTETNTWTLFKDRVIHFDEIKLEYQAGNIRPDILAYTNSIPLMIEILVTHGIDKNKLEQIKRLNISTIEISLTDINRAFELSDLRQAVIFAIHNKRWVYNRHTSENVLKQVVEGIICSQCDLKISQPDGPDHAVYDCPNADYNRFAKSNFYYPLGRFARRAKFSYGGDNMAWLGLDCECCPFCFDIKPYIRTDTDGAIHKTPIVACLGNHLVDPIIAETVKDGIIPPDWRKLVWE